MRRRVFSFLLFPYTAAALLCTACAPNHNFLRENRPGGITVRAYWHGRTAAQTAERLAAPLERELSKIEGVARILTRCDTEGCTLLLQYDASADGDRIAFDAASVIERTKALLPQGATAAAYTYDVHRPPDIVVALVLDVRQVTAAHYAAARDFAHMLMRLPALVQYRIPDMPVEKTYVELDPGRVNRLHRRLKTDLPELRTSAVAEAIRKEIVVVDDYQRILIGRRPGTRGDVGGIVLKRIGRTSIRVRDVARVSTVLTPPAVYRVNGEPAILIELFLRPGATPEEVRTCLNRVLVLKEKLPPLAKRLVPIRMRR